MKHNLDKPLAVTVLILVFFGVFMVFNASAPDAARTFGDKFFFFKRQVLWSVIGLTALFFCSQVKYTFWKRAAIPLMVISLILLVAVLIPGVGIDVLGAKRRISFGEVGVQPSEIAKLALVIFVAASLSKKVSILRFLIPTVVISGLVLAEPDLGTTIIIAACAFVIYFVSGAPLLKTAAVSLLAVAAGVLFALFSSYRRERVLAFLNPNIEPEKASYHIRQILIALGSGGIWGLGLGESRQKHLFIPEPATDSIFAIIAEETGIVGSIILICAFLFLLWRGITITLKIQEPFGRLLAVGITSLVGIQTFVNLAAMVALIPLTGIPLPLISYGGSSLVITLASLGILLNISKFNISN